MSLLTQVSPGKFCERELMVFPGYKVGSIQLLDIQNVSRVSSAPTCLNAHRYPAELINMYTIVDQRV
jgi:hypothetical protein